MRRIMFVLVFGVSLGLFLQVNPDTLPEKYVKKVIIEAKWGNGPGEFGLEPIDETYTWQTHLAIDNEGNFYIVDANNCRINVYNQNGKFIKEIKVPPEFLTYIGEDTIAVIEGIGVDSKGYIFISRTCKGTKIIKMDKNGKVVDRYFIKGIYLFPQYFYEDKEMYLWGSWSIGFSGVSDYLGDACISLSKIKSLEKGEVLREISLLASNTFKVVDKRRRISTLNLQGINENEWTINTTAPPAPFRVIKKEEKEYIIYEDWEGYIKINSKKKLLFNEDIRLLNNWAFLHPRLGMMRVSADALFDKDGNFYLIKGDPNGFKLIKYIINQEVWK